MTTTQTPAAGAIADTRFVAIQAGDRDFALSGDAVTEVIRMVALTPLPGTPEWLPGVVNLRGDVIPVVDLRVRLAVGEPECGLATPIVVAQHRSLRFGLIVDAVAGLIDGRMCEGTSFGGVGTPVIGGVAELDGVLVPVIDLAQVYADLHGAIPPR